MKKIGKVLVSLLFIFSLTGCVKYNITLKISETGQSNVEMEMLVLESYLKQVGQTSEEWINDVKKRAGDKLKESADINVDVKETSKTIDNQKYVGAVITAASEKQDENIKKEEKDGKTLLTYTIPLSDFDDSDLPTDELGDINFSQLKTMGVEMILRVEMPAKVKSTVGEVKDNVVTIDLLDMMDNQKKDIVITCEVAQNNNTTMMIVGGVVGAIVIAGVCWFIYKKKKTSQVEE